MLPVFTFDLFGSSFEVAVVLVDAAGVPLVWAFTETKKSVERQIAMESFLMNAPM
jgi:hypothetical protein